MTEIEAYSDSGFGRPAERGGVPVKLVLAPPPP